MYEMLTKAKIRHWLNQLILPGKALGMQSRPTLRSIARYTGIPKNTLEWMARKDTARLSDERQRLLSKVIALVDNGLLVWEVQGARKVAVLRDKPKPRVLYGVAIQNGQARLTFIDRVPPPRRMPSMKDLLLK